MGTKHSPSTEKVKHMLSDYNDHYEIRTRFLDDKENKQVKITIWFDSLRNSLRTTIDYKGNIDIGICKCIIDGTATSQEEINSILPPWAELREYFEDGENTSIKIVLHESRDHGKLDPQEYMSRVEQLKSTLLDCEFIYREFS